MYVNVKYIEAFFKSFNTNKIFLDMIADAERDGYTVRFFTDIKISNYELVKDPNIFIEKIKLLRNEILNSKLFDSEKKALAEYDKLKDMKFVLEELLKLDLEAIKNKPAKPEDTFLFKNDQLNLYLGRKKP